MTLKTRQLSSSSSGIACHISGKGRPLVLLHGVGLCAQAWAAQSDEFSQTKQVFALDLPGHGNSRALEVYQPLVADYTDQIALFMKESEIDPALIVGHSLGALIALDLASRYPQLCQSVAALAPIYQRPERAQRAVRQRAKNLRRLSLEAVAESPVKRWFGAAPTGRNLELANLCSDWLSRTDRNGYAQAYYAFAEDDGVSDAALATLKLPVLFLTADEDPNSTPAMTLALAEKVVGAKAVIVNGARHMVPMTHPEQVNAALARLLDRNRMDADPMRAAATK